jgi:predicted dehydrogenase
MTRPGIAVVGLGMAVTPHAKSLIDLADRAEVRHAFSPSAARRNAFAERFPSFPLAVDLDAVLGDPAVDAVFVLTPPNTHLDLVRRCAAAGKHVLLEKPLEVRTERAVALVQACRAAGVRLGAVLQHRFRPAGMRLREILASGRLGPIAGCSTFCRLWRPQDYYDAPGRGTRHRDGGGVLITQAIHTLDLMLSLAGPVREVAGFWQTSPLHRMETEDMVCAALRYANGAIGTLDATTAAYPGFPERIELICRHGSALLAGTSLEVHYHDGTAEQVAADRSSGGTGADPMDFPHDYHRSLIDDFLAALAHGREPRVTGEAALAVHRLIDALIETGTTGRSVAVTGG